MGSGEFLGDVGQDWAAALLTLSELDEALALEDWARRREWVEALEGRRRNKPFVGSMLQTPVGKESLNTFQFEYAK